MTQTSLFQNQEQYTIDIGDTGNLMLPSEVCRQLNLKAGDRLSLTVESDGSLRLVNIRTQVAKFQGIFKDIAPGVSLADELIQERRKEARHKN